MRPLAALLYLIVVVPLAQAHAGERHANDPQLLAEGEKLMVGRFTATQAGPLLVVPFLEGPLPCADDHLVPYRVGIAGNASLTVLQNATHIEAGFALPHETQRYVAFGLDTGEAVRALFVMQEYVVAIHRLAATTLKEETVTLHQGHLGVPHVAGPSAHGLSHRLEGGGISIAYGPGGPAETCPTGATERVSFRFERGALGDGAAPGRVPHAVALYDPNFDQALPRPIDNSTTVFQANLYLARPGEDPAALRAAFEPQADAQDWVPLAGLALGLLAVGGTALRRARPG